MKESILFAPSLNGTEFIRTMARFGVNTLGFRIVSALELAEIALMRSGIAMTAGYVSKKEAPSVIFRFLAENGYFRASSYADAENIFTTLNEIRLLIPSDEYSVMAEKLQHGEFIEKNLAVLDVYEKYINALETDNRADDISIIRMAAEQADSFDADFITADEYPLRPIEKALLERVSGGRVRRVSVPQIFGAEVKDISEPVINEAYGRINEVSHIVSDIYSGKIPADKCVVACSDPGAYSQVFYDVATAYNIPVSYGCGVPILNSNPAKLLKYMYEWNTTGYNGAEALGRMVFCEAFDRRELAEVLGIEKPEKRILEGLCTMAGNLRISFDRDVNRKRLDAVRAVSAEEELVFVRYAEILASEFEKGWAYFTGRYSIRRIMPDGKINRLDNAAVSLITETIDGYVNNVPGGNACDIVQDILGKRICIENSIPGALHITSIGGAVSSLRENLYVCGLSSLEFPGSAAENYIMLDKDAEMFDDGITAPTSVNRIRRKKDELNFLLKMAGSLDVRTTLSYCGYSLAELKEQNPSSELYRIYERLHSGCGMDDFRKAIIPVGYFSDWLSVSGAAGKQYSEGYDISGKGKAVNLPRPEGILERRWAPTRLECFLSCPLRFYLVQCMGIDEPDTDSVLSVITPKEIGTAAHALMEKLGAEDMTKEAFLKAASDMFDVFMIKRPPVIEKSVSGEKHAFMEMMGRAYDMNTGNEIVSAEEMMEADHPSGILLKGRADRVERRPDGSIIVSDFKTGRITVHEKDDYISCFQVIVYAWICGAHGVDVASGEYRYLRKSSVVSCRYDQEMEEKLAETLGELRDAAESGVFPAAKDDKACKYCGVKNLCDSIRKSDETGDSADV